METMGIYDDVTILLEEIQDKAKDKVKNLSEDDYDKLRNKLEDILLFIK